GRILPRHNHPLRAPRPSLSSLRRPHAHHPDVRAGSASSPSPLRATGPNRDQYLMTPAPPPQSLSSLYRCFQPATTVHVLFPTFTRHLPPNPPTHSTKSHLIPSAGAPPPSNHYRPRLSPCPPLHRRRQRNFHSAR